MAFKYVIGWMIFVAAFFGPAVGDNPTTGPLDSPQEQQHQCLAKQKKGMDESAGKVVMWPMRVLVTAPQTGIQKGKDVFFWAYCRMLSLLHVQLFCPTDRWEDIHKESWGTYLYQLLLASFVYLCTGLPTLLAIMTIRQARAATQTSASRASAEAQSSAAAQSITNNIANIMFAWPCELVVLVAICYCIIVPATCVAMIILLMLLAFLVFPVLDKMKIWHVNQEILFCAHGIGFSKFILVPYIVLQLMPLRSAFRHPRQVMKGFSKPENNFLTSALKTSALKGWHMLLFEQLKDALTYSASFLLTDSCSKAENMNVFPISVSTMQLASGVVAILGAACVTYAGTKGTGNYMFFVTFCLTGLLSDAPQAYASYLLDTSCETPNQYTLYSAVGALINVFVLISQLVACARPYNEEEGQEKDEAQYEIAEEGRDKAGEE